MNRCALVACLGLLAGPAPAQWKTNLVDDPSFERDDNRDGGPDGWTASAFRSPAKLAWDDAVAHHGRRSVRIRDSANPDAREWNQRTGRWISAARCKVAPGRPYALGVWVRTDGVTGSASACIAWWKSGGWLAESYTQRLTGTGGWRHVSVRATPPAGADGAQVYLSLSGSRGTAWFDDVVFVQGDELPARFQPVDLAKACNVGFRDEKEGDGKGGWTDQGDNDMRNLPTGRVVLRGVPFDILEPAKSGGKSCVVLKGRGTAHGPERVAIPLARKARTIHFLHAAGWAPAGQPVGRYELAYEDGSTARLALTSGRQLADWWDVSDTPRAAVAWEGANPARDGVGLHVYPAANPKPDRAIREVRAVAGGGEAVLMLVAITTSDGPAVLPARPIRHEFTDTTGWYEFTFPLDDTNLDALDLTRFLDPPAGRHGFLAVRGDGHFAFADGTRARFWGTNVGGPGAFPEKADAAALAARLAKYGVNLLRIHAIDGQWGRLIDYARGDSQHLRADMLDRLDFFFAELKKRGIYVYFDCLDYRRFLPGDGVRDAAQFQHGWQNSIKGATIFNDRLIELQKTFATAFYTHRNPYTKLRYCDDPAVAVVEITNENSVFYFRNTRLTLPTYVEELTRRWNRWLVDNCGSRAKISSRWARGDTPGLLAEEDPLRGTVHLPMKHLYQDPAAAGTDPKRSPARVSDMIRFFVDLERRYYGEMRSHLRKIGVRVPITGTNQTFCSASTYADSVNDFMSRNNYWQHPNVRAKPFVTFRNSAVVASDLAKTSNPIVEVASSTVAGKPMIVPEYNFPWPNEYRAECLPLMAAYACLQNWDGMLFFSYRPGGKALEHFGSQSDPVRWGQFPAAALLYHRRDVDVARHTVQVTWPEEDIFAGGAGHGRAKTSPFRHLAYVHQVRNLFLRPREKWGLKTTGPDPNASPNRRVSDTGQLHLHTDRGLFLINTPRTKAAVGFLAKARKLKLGGVTVECRTPFAAVMVTSLRAERIGASRRVLVTAVARAENTGQAFHRNRTAIPEKGRAPVLAEPVRCTVAVPMPGAATAYALDETGKRRNKLPATVKGRTVELPTDAARTPWIELVAE